MFTLNLSMVERRLIYIRQFHPSALLLKKYLVKLRENCMSYNIYLFYIFNNNLNR